MRSKIAVFLSLSVLLLLCGCLEFEEQSLAYRYDEKADTLYIFQEYRGIFGGERKEGLSGDEVEQLSSVLATERTFFFANWIFEYNRTSLLETQKELKGPAAADDTSMTPEERKQVLGLVDLVLANVKVENGPLYHDANQHLCGIQKVTIKKASEIIRSANLVMPMALKSLAKDDDQKENRAALLKAAEKRKEFIRLEKNVLSVVWPVNQKDFDKAFGPAPEPLKMVEAFKKSGGKATFKDEEMTLTLGRPEDKVTVLTMPVAKADTDFKGYLPNAVPDVKKKTVILEKFDVEAARKEFLK